MALELQDVTSVILEAYLDTANQVRLRHGTHELSDHNEQLVARSDADAITFEIAGLAGWQLSVTHMDAEGETVSWAAGARGVDCEISEATTDPLEVTVTAQNAAETKKKKVYIEAKPKGALPDRP
ncbi:hypothetical protein [Enhygromyxa salina]|uniref:Uncharacterized protein n=1 Tax=Enhygromyxa salina TaxID=215803 RepID=A0A2S9YRZ4_9BACT|nr:hypothetical protein [Enhygromyxa salina]PRQ07829.1 hypothetical protein ENSA7_25010 [Enhygromyxa salina]